METELLTLNEDNATNESATQVYPDTTVRIGDTVCTILAKLLIESLRE